MSIIEENLIETKTNIISETDPLYKMNYWYLILFFSINIILMTITIIYSYKTKIINKNVYIIFLVLDILSILVNIFLTFFLTKKNLINNDYSLYHYQSDMIVIYFLLNIILTSIAFYFIIDSLYGSWVDQGNNRQTLRLCISVFSIFEFFVVIIIKSEWNHPQSGGMMGILN